jgi:hypothetical protein
MEEHQQESWSRSSGRRRAFRGDGNGILFSWVSAANHNT